MTLAVEDSNTKLVDVVAFAGVDTEESVEVSGGRYPGFLIE